MVLSVVFKLFFYFSNVFLSLCYQALKLWMMLFCVTLIFFVTRLKERQKGLEETDSDDLSPPAVRSLKCFIF